MLDNDKSDIESKTFVAKSSIFILILFCHYVTNFSLLRLLLNEDHGQKAPTIPVLHIHSHLLPVIFLKSSVYRAAGLPALSLPNRGLHYNT